MCKLLCTDSVQVQGSVHPVKYDIAHLTDQTMDATDFRHTLNAIHSGAINTFTDLLTANGVLGFPPSPIENDELGLTPESRVNLAQHRSGYCCWLNSYLSRIALTYQNCVVRTQKMPTIELMIVFICCPFSLDFLTEIFKS